MSRSEHERLAKTDRLRKLRAMSVPEVWSRLRYDAYCRFERRTQARGRVRDGDRFRNALVRHLRNSPAWRDALVSARRDRTARFFPGVERKDETRTLFLDRYPAERERARVEADKAFRREFSFFGGTYRYPQRVDWHADPVSGAQWPRVYHRDLLVDGGNIGYGDVKHVWELGRHQFLIDLAKIWAIDRDASYSAAARALVSDWRAQNPVGIGVGWACALEPAFRVLSWLWAYFFMLDDAQFDPDCHIDWLEGFHDHGWFLYRHLEYYTSPFNHLIGEACALYCLGVLFPEFEEAPKWRAHGRKVLESRLAGQFYRDGGSVEQSTFYHHATTGFYILAALMGRANGEEFSANVWAAIERAIEFSAAIQQPDGTIPRIGGADDGKPIRLEHLPLWDFRPYHAIGAVMFSRADFKAAAGRFFEDALWLLGPDGLAAFDASATAPPSPPSRVRPASGYVVIRSDWTTDADYICLDCGEQAAGLRKDDIPSAAHGHADCLSVTLWRRGRPVLVDAGFYCYNGEKSWQDHFRETAAHNTVRIDGRDQARHITKMAWSHTYTAKLEAYRLDGPAPWAVGSHDGYQHLPRGAVLHRRAIWARPRGYVVVCDFLEGTGSHDIELTFQFAPGGLVVNDRNAIFDDWSQLHWFAPVELSANVYEGGPGPHEGWIAPSLGVRLPAPRLVLGGTTTVPVTVVSILSDLLAERIGVTSTSAAGAAPIRISTGEWQDWLIVRGLSDGAIHGLRTDALAAIWKREGDRFVADGFIGGTFQR